MIDPDEAVHLAEQATLGALLLAPQHVRAVQGWLRPADFADPWNAEVYNLIREHHTAGRPLDAATMGPQLIDRLGAQHAAVVQVHDLLEATPPRPDPVTYGRMVLDAALRREIAGQGVLLQAGTLQAALSGESVPMTATCALVDAGLTAAGNRWALATGEPVTGLETPVPLRAALRNLDLRLGADKLLRTHPRRDPVAERAHEMALVAGLIAHPDAIADVAVWLSPRRLVTPGWRTVYAATVELAELGRRVDLVTVTWATQRLSHHDQPSPSVRDLRVAVDGARFEVPHHAATRVAIDQLRRIADNGAHQLTTGADNPGLLITDLVDTGHLITGALRQTAAALPERHDASATAQLGIVRSLEAARGQVAR